MHDLALFGFGVVIPSKTIDEKDIDIHEIATRYGLHVDWIEDAVDDERRGNEDIPYVSSYIITYERTRKEIYDCNYGVHTWFQEKDCWKDISQAKIYFSQLGDKLGMLLDPQWILAVYRM